jgi:hypothetical protein
MMRLGTRNGWHRTRLASVVAIVALALGAAGCDEDGIVDTLSEDELAPPLGLGSITGNQQVTLTWFTSNFEGDFEGYIVYQSTGDLSTDQSVPLPAGFLEVERLTASSSGGPRSLSVGGLVNGTTYSFAVVAFRDDGNEISRTSNIVADTPRPDITSVTLTSASTNDVTGDDTSAGFRFDDFAVLGVPPNLASVSYMDPGGADIVHEAFDPGSSNSNIRSWLAGMNGAGVQDLGYMTDLDGSDVAPPDGYAGNGESVLLTVGHVYAIRTGADRYGKIIVTAIEGFPGYRITFNAAFQTKAGEPDYMRALGIGD